MGLILRAHNKFVSKLYHSRNMVAITMNKVSVARRGLTASNGCRTRAMQVINPMTNIKYENMSYLPPLSDSDIAKQVEYLTENGWTPCIEFAPPENAFVNPCQNNAFAGGGYYDNRYWTMYKLPMYGCTNAEDVLEEINNCVGEYPSCFVRVLGFDATRQVQCAGLIVRRP